MIVTVEFTKEEAIDIIESIGNNNTEDVVNAVERLENVTRQVLREGRRTARASMRVARYTQPVIEDDVDDADYVVEADEVDEAEELREFDEGR